MKRLLSVVFAFVLIVSALSGCSTNPVSPTGPSTTVPPETAVPVFENEKGPFDSDHYKIGLRALQAIDAFLAGDVSISDLNNTLSTCYADISAIPELPETDPLAAGNYYVKGCVFLVKIDFEFQLSDFDKKKYEDRNYLAASIGEPEKEFDVESSNRAQLESFLTDIFETLQTHIANSKFSYSWYNGDLFIDIVIHDFDYFWDNKESLTEESLETVLEISHSYVIGDVAQSLYNSIRKVGGEGFDIYITLGGRTLFCASRNLEIIMDPLNQ